MIPSVNTNTEEAFMKQIARYSATGILVLASALLFVHGPIYQPAHYHEFADQSSLPGIAHATDVLSNVGFALIAIWGAVRLHRSWLPSTAPSILKPGSYGYGLFLLALLLTAFGSTYYHLAPDDWRLVWDRLPIALACAGLLAGSRAELVASTNERALTFALALLAVASVMWWHFGQINGGGDLRPYLMLQAAPLVLIPIWQATHAATRSERRSLGLAILLYVLAKIAELHDHDILAALGWLSGHTLKHLLASAAAWVLVAALIKKYAANPDANHRRRPVVTIIAS